MLKNNQYPTEEIGLSNYNEEELIMNSSSGANNMKVLSLLALFISFTVLAEPSIHTYDKEFRPACKGNMLFRNICYKQGKDFLSCSQSATKKQRLRPSPRYSNDPVFYFLTDVNCDNEMPASCDGFSDRLNLKTTRTSDICEMDNSKYNNYLSCAASGNLQHSYTAQRCAIRNTELRTFVYSDGTVTDQFFTQQPQIPFVKYNAKPIISAVYLRKSDPFSAVYTGAPKNDIVFIVGQSFHGNTERTSNGRTLSGFFRGEVVAYDQSNIEVGRMKGGEMNLKNGKLIINRLLSNEIQAIFNQSGLRFIVINEADGKDIYTNYPLGKMSNFRSFSNSSKLVHSYNIIPTSEESVSGAFGRASYSTQSNNAYVHFKYTRSGGCQIDTDTFLTLTDPQGNLVLLAEKSGSPKLDANGSPLTTLKSHCKMSFRGPIILPMSADFALMSNQLGNYRFDITTNGVTKTLHFKKCDNTKGLEFCDFYENVTRAIAASQKLVGKPEIIRAGQGGDQWNYIAWITGNKFALNSEVTVKSACEGNVLASSTLDPSEVSNVPGASQGLKIALPKDQTHQFARGLTITVTHGGGSDTYTTA